MIEEFITTKNNIHKIIFGIISLFIYLLISIYIMRKFAKYRKINKTLLRDSIIVGLVFGIAAYIYVRYGLSDGKIFENIGYIAVFTSFLAGSFFWYLIFWNRRMTVLNGIYAGVLTILLSNILFWYFSYWITEINKISFQTLGFLDLINIMGLIIGLPMAAIMMTLLGFAFQIRYLMLIYSFIIGGFTGGLVAYIYKKLS
jgi:uncharacterized protein YacL